MIPHGVEIFVGLDPIDLRWSFDRLHQLDPEAYLRDLFRVLAHWPRDRYLELAPRYWARTRARLDPRQLAAELGDLDVPPPLTPPAAEQVPADLPA